MNKLKTLSVLSVALLLVSGCSKNPTSSSDSSEVTSDVSETTSEETTSEESSSEESSSIDQTAIREKITTLVTAASEKESSVISCEVTNVSDYGWGETSTTTTINYGQNNNGKLLKRAIVDSYSSAIEYYYHTVDGEVEGYKYNVSEEKYEKVYSVEDSAFSSYNFAGGIINPEYDTISGALAAVNQILNFADLNSNKDAAYEMVDDYSFSVSFGYAAVTPYITNYYYTVATVTFDSSTGAISGIESKLYNPAAESVIVDDENNTFTVSDLSTSSYTSVSYTQTIGDLVDLNFPYYSLSQWKLSSFDVALDGAVIENGSTVSIEAADYGLSKNLTLVNTVPETFNPAFETFTVTTPENAFAGYYNSFSNSFSLSIKEIREHTVTIISSLGHSVTFIVNVTAPQPQSISFNVVKNDGTDEEPIWGDYYNVPTTMYLGDSINITAKVSPSSADQGSTVTCDKATLTTGTYSIWSASGLTYYTFTPTELGTYTFTATSTVNASITETTTIEVIERPSLDEMFSGTYYKYNSKGDYLEFSLVFTPSAEVELTGTASFNVHQIGSTDFTSYSYTYVIDSESGVCTFTAVDSTNVYYPCQPVSGVIDSDGNLELTVYQSTADNPTDGWTSYLIFTRTY